MNRNLSIWLDLVRFCAALAVMLGHSHLLLVPGLPRLLTAHAAEAVAVFFVLSGFVIRFVTSQKEVTLNQYASARAIRIYSVAIPALMLTFVIDRIGIHIDPGYYAGLELWKGPMELPELLASLSFLNEAWGFHIVAGSNEPYWSLGYEVAYYVAFAATFVASRRWKVALLIAWCLVFGPFIVSYAALWGMGVVLYDVLSKLPRQAASLDRKAAIFLMLAPVAYPLLKYGIYPPLGTLMRHGSIGQYALAWTYYMLIGSLFSLHVLGFYLLFKDRFLFSTRTERLIRWLAGSTFTIYLMHMPLIVFVGAVRVHWWSSTSGDLLALAGVLLALVLLSYFGERRKAELKAVVSRLGMLLQLQR